VVLATGAGWRRDGVGRRHWKPVPGSDRESVLSASDIMAGAPVGGPVVLYDDDHFYLGGVLAGKLRGDGHEVTLVTPAPDVSHWTHFTLEQHRIQKRLLEAGVDIVTQHMLGEIGEGSVELACVFTGRRSSVPCATLVMVTSRLPADGVYRALLEDAAALSAAGIESVTAIGDCLAPSTIAAAVYAGHRYARELDEPAVEGAPFLREFPALS
jgi:dimethylamine/trimethylamine dehydrogenase